MHMFWYLAAPPPVFCLYTDHNFVFGVNGPPNPCAPSPRYDAEGRLAVEASMTKHFAASPGLRYEVAYIRPAGRNTAVFEFARITDTAPPVRDACLALAMIWNEIHTQSGGEI